jgi:hypothetical protein
MVYFKSETIQQFIVELKIKRINGFSENTTTVKENMESVFF